MRIEGPSASSSAAFEIRGVVVVELGREPAQVVGLVDHELLGLLVEEPSRVAQLEDALAKRAGGERGLPRRSGELGLVLESLDARDPAAAREHDRLLAIEEPCQRLGGVEAHAQLPGRRQIAQRRTSSISSKKPSVS